MVRTILVSAIALVALSGAAPAYEIDVATGTARTFAVHGTPPKPGRPRHAPIGPAAPGPGEITVGLAPAGHAVTLAKLHVYERTPAPVAFEATAMRGGKRLATQTMCGQLELDTWATFPAETDRVRLSKFSMAKADCGR